MKKIILLPFLLIAISTYCQESTVFENKSHILKSENVNTVEYGNDTFASVSQMPTFSEDINIYLRDNLKYPPQAADQGIYGRVVAKFVVAKDGSIHDVKIKRSVCPSIDAEAIRVLSTMPNWNPGKLNGKPVAVYYTVPVNFMLGNLDSKSLDIFFNNSIEHLPNHPAIFPNGYLGFIQFLSDNYKEVPNVNNQSISLKVSAEVDEDGKLSNINISNLDNVAANAEALRLVKLFPTIIPEMQNGFNISSKVYFEIPFYSQKKLAKLLKKIKKG